MGDENHIIDNIIKEFFFFLKEYREVNEVKRYLTFLYVYLRLKNFLCATKYHGNNILTLPPDSPSSPSLPGRPYNKIIQ